jgi:colicin import membrane protein
VEIIEQEVLDRAEINDGNVVVEYSRTEAALAELRQKYSGVVFDCTTTKGDKEARAARLELTSLRTSLEKKRKEFKAPALEFGKKIDSEAARVTSEILAIENPIDEQIKADEKRRADEKAERERIEAERIKVIKDKIATIRGFVGKCQGISADRIANGIDMVSKISTSADEFAEFEGEAKTAQAETLQAMRELHAATKAREEEAERVETQRIENERIAEEQRIASEKLAAERAELERQQQAQAEALAAQQAEIDRRESELKAEQERIAQESARQAEAAKEAECVEPERAAQVKEVASNEAAPISQPAPAIKQDDGARIKLGEINLRIAPLSITADGLAQLGFVHISTDKSAKLYRESDFAAICKAMADHLNSVTDFELAAS